MCSLFEGLYDTRSPTVGRNWHDIVVLSQMYLTDSLHNLSWSLIFINDALHVVTAIPRLIVLSCSRFLFKSPRVFRVPKRL
jgi:hypothetical protein